VTLGRKTPLQRNTPLVAKTSLRRTTGLQQKAGRESLSARSVPLRRSSIAKSAPKRMSEPRDPGPSPEVVEAAVERDRYSCVRCGYGIGPGERGRRWSLHHRKRRSQGGEHTPQNLILLCGGSDADGCHQYVHGHPEESRAAGWLLKAKWEPLAVPILIPLEDRRVWLGADGLYRDVA